MKQRTVAAMVTLLLIAVSVTGFYALRNGITPESNSAPESVNEFLAPAQNTLPGVQLESSPLPAEPENEVQSAEDVAKKIDNGEVHSWPTYIEDRIWEYFAHRQKSNIISINSVECTDTDCVIEFSGSELNPQHVDEFSDLAGDMYRQGWNVRTGSIGTREIAPNVRVFVISISNVPVDMDQLRRGDTDTQPENESTIDHQQ